MKKRQIEEREHILNILRKVENALQKKKYIEIKNLSNQIIHNASIHQQPEVISLAVIFYSLSKFLERGNYKEYKQWPTFINGCIGDIEDARKALETGDIETFRFELSSMREKVQTLPGNLKKNINEVFRMAKINKASRIYEHGISMEKTAKILGITQWELAEYAGKTGIGNVNLGITIPVTQRIKQAEDIFK